MPKVTLLKRARWRKAVMSGRITNTALLISLAGWILAGWARAGTFIPDSFISDAAAPEWFMNSSRRSAFSIFMLFAGLFTQFVATALNLAARKGPQWRFYMVLVSASWYVTMVFVFIIG